MKFVVDGFFLKFKNKISFFFFGTKKMLERILNENLKKQILNIENFLNVTKVIFLPDLHQGYFFPIGTVVKSINNQISPIGVGKDINCGVLFSYCDLNISDINEFDLKNIFNYLKKNINIEKNPNNFEFKKNNLKAIMENGLSFFQDINYSNFEEKGFFKTNFSYSQYSEKELKKIILQLGTIGHGNHFLEIGYISQNFGFKNNTLKKGTIVCLIHTGSRGFGASIFNKYNFNSFIDFNSRLGKIYENHFKRSCNYAWVNRKILLDVVNKYFEITFKKKFIPILDHSHNSYSKINDTIIHRKGAAKIYDYSNKKKICTIIPGNMYEGSYFVLGRDVLYDLTLGSLCHGAGRMYSRKKSKQLFTYSDIKKELKKRKILASGSIEGLIEEFKLSYKNIEEIIQYLEKNKLIFPIYKINSKIVIKG